MTTSTKHFYNYLYKKDLFLHFKYFLFLNLLEENILLIPKKITKPNKLIITLAWSVLCHHGMIYRNTPLAVGSRYMKWFNPEDWNDFPFSEWCCWVVVSLSLSVLTVIVKIVLIVKIYSRLLRTTLWGLMSTLPIYQTYLN